MHCLAHRKHRSVKLPSQINQSNYPVKSDRAQSNMTPLFYVPHSYQMFHTKHIAGSRFRVFDGGGGEDDAMSGLIGADRDRAHAQSNDRDRARSQSNDRDRAQSNDRRKSEEITPESETGFETGVGLRTGLETALGTGTGTGTGT